MDLHLILVAFHVLGFAFGVGGATASDLVFIRSIKDGSVSQDEYNIIKTISTVVWTSVVLLFLSGLALVTYEYARWGEIPRLGFSFFQLKLTAFAVLVLNGIVFHGYIFPMLKKTIGGSFRSDEIRRKYGWFAVTGGISIVSWYTAFIAVAFSRVLIEYPYLFLVNVYLLLVAGAGLMAYLVINMHADEAKNPLAAIRTIYRHRLTLVLVLLAGVLFAGALWQGYELFIA